MITVSPELEIATRMSEAEIQRELAVYLYAQGKLSLGKAKTLAGMTIWEFQQLLASRDLLVHYGEDDFVQDLATIERLGLDK